MSDLKADVLKNFGNKLRIRVCGLYIENNRLLLLKHYSISAHEVLWSPPGGGMDFAEHTAQTLVREFEEETGLTPTVYEFGFVHEYLNPPMHAVELFFIIMKAEGTAQLGKDPEMTGEQMLQELAFVDLETLRAIPDEQKHSLLRGLNTWDELMQRTGYSLDNYIGR
ncbi:MAG: NUDIX hydrolase [Cytophagaceae bacterium]|nr:NUDIX hydrolase [Cytophagaceae bacterium]